MARLSSVGLLLALVPLSACVAHSDEAYPSNLELVEAATHMAFDSVAVSEPPVAESDIEIVIEGGHGGGWLVKKIMALQSHTTSNPNSFAQAGALAALEGPQEPVEEMRRAFAQRRDRIYELLCGIPGVKVPKPRGAFYIFPDVSAFGLGSMEFAERLLAEKLVAVIPGLPFGADRHIRLSYACGLDTIEKACGRLAEFCAEL